MNEVKCLDIVVYLLYRHITVLIKSYENKMREISFFLLSKFRGIIAEILTPRAKFRRTFVRAKFRVIEISAMQIWGSLGRQTNFIYVNVYVNSPAEHFDIFEDFINKAEIEF